LKGDEEWQRFCAAIGRPELLENESYKTHGRRKRNEDALDAEVSSWTHGCDKWQLSDVLQERGIAASPVEDLRDHIEVDPQLRDHFQSIRQPCDPEQEVLVDREPIRFAGHELALRRAPMLGEHNEYVFKDLLAMSEADIDRLIVARVIH
ncbi:MAG TPA: CoA transferase, partial [Dehalococcoidia bacterium]